MVYRQRCRLRAQHELACLIVVCTLGASAVRQNEAAVVRTRGHAVAATTDDKATAANNATAAWPQILQDAAANLWETVSSYKGAAAQLEDDPVTTLHVIGDTHGDHNYLVRCLLSTGRFDLHSSDGSHGIKWKDSPQEEDWKILVLGDLIDRHRMSRENLETVKALQDDGDWGNRLVVVLGNHEAMMLRLQVGKYGDRASGWLAEHRLAAMAATEGKDFELVEWLRNLPVVHYTHGVLMLHAGLQNRVAEDLKTKARCTRTGPECGTLVADYINTEARAFFAERISMLRREVASRAFFAEWISMLRRLGASKAASVISATPNKAEQWWLWDGNEGILWFRGHSSGTRHYNSGSPLLCENVASMGKTLGASMVAVAHNAHQYITKYCSEVPVYSTDTHPSDCVENDECDFHVKHGYHYDSLKIRKNVPQNLRIDIFEEVRYADEDEDEYRYKSEACLFRLNERSLGPTTKCFGFEQKLEKLHQRLNVSEVRH